MRNLKLDRVIYRRAALEEIIELRNSVLIQGTNRDTPFFDGDREIGTLHFGAFLGERTIGCLTFLMNSWENEPAWQLRGMASDPEYRGVGLGAGLLAYAESVLRVTSTVNQMWCNARAGAVGFYQRQGWIAVSNEFLIPGVGSHFKMIKSMDRLY